MRNVRLKRLITTEHNLIILEAQRQSSSSNEKCCWRRWYRREPKPLKKAHIPLIHHVNQRFTTYFIHKCISWISDWQKVLFLHRWGAGWGHKSVICTMGQKHERLKLTYNDPTGTVTSTCTANLYFGTLISSNVHQKTSNYSNVTNADFI